MILVAIVLAFDVALMVLFGRRRSALVAVALRLLLLLLLLRWLLNRLRFGITRP